MRIVTRRDAAKLLAAGTVAVGLTGVAVAQDENKKGPTLATLALPKDEKKALQALKGWLEARGFDCTVNKGGDSLQYKRGVLLNIQPIVADPLGLLYCVAYYTPEVEFKNSDELDKLAARTNAAQKFLRVFISSDRYFGVSGCMTFHEEFTAREFDAFVDEMATVIRRHILSDAAVKKLLK
jgi:hypothetical protein